MQQFKNVLLVDYNTSANFIAYRSIRRLQLAREVHISRNGLLAVKFLQDYLLMNGNKAPELIIIDPDLPVMDGFELLKEMERMYFINKDEVKVVVTGYSPEKLHELPFRFIFINKPITPEKLIDVV